MKALFRCLTAALAAILMISACACAPDVPGEVPDSDSSSDSDTTGGGETPASSDIVVATPGSTSDFYFVYNASEGGSDLVNSFKKVRDAFKDTLGATLIPKDHYCDQFQYEIVLGSKKRALCVELTDSLEAGEYAIKAVKGEDTVSIIIAYKGELARVCAVDRFISEFVKEDGVIIPEDTFIKEKREMTVITSSISNLRDPCILVEKDAYYAYGTGWVCYKNTSGSLDGDWQPLGTVVSVPADAETNYWAPEVHKYNGAYYMFTTYKSKKTGHRGCTVMKASSPEGPFVEITDGPITPATWDAIDGTFYVDRDGQPWMIFVHEWTSTDDGIGRMAAAKLSDDLTHFISEPIELFRADTSPWTKRNVTDGCWMYECSDGELIMIWSNFDANGGYAVGIARSDNGKVDGNWTHDYTTLYSKSLSGTYDGGHGMIFVDTDGQMYLSIHSPNTAVEGRKEKPVFIPIREENGTLVWD